MNDVDRIQKDILELAYETFSKMKFGEGFSFPFVPRISEGYFKNRLVVMGQETYTWCDRCTWCGHINNLDQVKEWCLDGKCLCNGYDDFVNKEAEKYGGKFWEFSRSMYENVFKSKMCDNGQLSHCWMNLYCIEKCQRGVKGSEGKPSQNKKLAECVMDVQKDFVYHVLKMIRPKIILALIGNRNNFFFEKNALGAEHVGYIPLDQSGTFDEQKLAEVKIGDNTNPFKDSLIIRAYHPSYFMGRMKKNKKLYRKLIYDKIKEKI